MKITEVLSMVDALYPNAYTVDEKARWCYEASAGIRRNVLKLYEEMTYVLTNDNEKIPLPEGVTFMDIESVFVNGKRTAKVDSRSFMGNGLSKGDTVRVVYKIVPEPFVVTDGVVDADAVTEVPAPYDGLYIDYVCAQIAFNQNAMSDYQKFMAMYNEKLTEFAVEYQKTAPTVEGRGYTNLW